MIIHQVSVEDSVKEEASNIQKHRASLLKKNTLASTMRISDDENALSMQVMSDWNNFASRVRRVSPRPSAV